MIIKKIKTKEMEENYLQSELWASIKTTKNNNWKAIAFKSDVFGKIVVMQRRLFKNFYLAYIPHPEFSNKTLDKINIDQISTNIKEFSMKIKSYLHENTIFLRFDFMYYYQRTLNDKYSPLKIKIKYLKKSFDDIQPSSTTILNLNNSLENILLNMKKKTRYNIKLSAKKNLNVLIDDEFKHLNEFYKLYKETSKRDKFTIHSEEYIQNLIKIFKQDKNAQIKLILAFYNNIIVSGIIVGIYKEKAVYLYGASSNEYRNLMPNYAVQFKAIQILKKLGIKEYDLLGIPPIANKKHPLSGLFAFKTGFGGNIIHRIGCYDFTYKNFIYKIYTNLEKLRYFYYKVIRKKI
ncbi:lipid II:glycine glycyltransferase FemX [Borreliella yangtzensis]|uniref:Lipid II:glycine glycyltransferase (Peptidoglycan interpeptide bridge formation enzyme) n=2 Tax=Borreliella TaxID=64895 RepID=A0ABR6P8H0_9SPIR|nr:peptidoglycan bridge formation glycyltransferase FemA/FemB family protein [Borreliella yangtzensis]MBB6042573.1 lipid II:glycine glycyltransferase (peptidoglycan interpeptide bridge formation enzyme) [Borreliella yangtzensis]WKC73541.1 peptidoglycan bridge formation glycyltransferase FemA/FemB family protein [Borreliella yangtzensis]WKC74457.1 peptidoglycan bridge formation glycyltransferase FemA/FemB family protein [Borreliella yangtzensis]